MNIKRVVILALITIVHLHVNAGVDVCCKQDKHRSFLYTRPFNQNMAMYQAVWHDYIYEKYGYLQSSVQIIGAYQESIESDETNKYFIFNCKDFLRIAGDNTTEKDERDVRAEWLGLPSNFIGTLKLVPKQRQSVALINFHQDIEKIVDISFLNDYWVDISVPIIAVENKLILEEQIGQTTADAPISNLVAAFDRSDLAYAKVDPKARTRVNLAEVKIKFGKAYMAEDHYQIIYYSGFSIPVGNKQNAKYVFDPVVGNNGHFGIIAGVSFQLVTSRCECPYVSCLFLNVENMFLARNDQYRTLDLKNNPWSRYLLLNKKNGGPSQNIPAATILTRKVQVHPYAMVEVSVGGRFLYNGFDLEIGYDLWAHAQERLELKQCLQPIWGIAGAPDPDNPAFATTASKSTICERKANNDMTEFDTDNDGNPMFVPIRDSDFDLKSGATKHTLVHKAHLSFGWGHKGRRFDGFFGIGLWFEIPQDIGALKLAGGWFKMGGSF